MSSKNCLRYLPRIEESECIIITEASSSKTAIFSFNAELGINKINDQSELYLKGSQYQIDLYAKNNDARGYFNIMFNSVIHDHILTSNCSSFHWALLATDGMRGRVSIDLQEKFYKGIEELFADGVVICNDTVCKNNYLLKIETINAESEGKYAWISLKQKYNTTCHAVLDIGGQSGQFTNASYVFSDSLGKVNARYMMHGYDAKEDLCDSLNGLNVTACYSNQNNRLEGMKYNGASCREAISKYISCFFNLPVLDYDRYCKVYAISNFYNYFNDICNAYLPYIEENSLFISEYTVNKIKSVCGIKNQSDEALAMDVVMYKNITDEVCNYWNDNWVGNMRDFAKDACFSGNYNAQILEAFGFAETVSVDQVSWAFGAASGLVEDCVNIRHSYILVGANSIADSAF